jgi:hypothetical protein
MGNFLKVMLTIASALITVSISTPAAATKVDQALAFCSARGPDCHAMRVNLDGSTVVVIICVNNSGTGDGVQCVQCAGDEDCSIARKVPTTKRGVEGVLTNNMRAR